jgi:hypothetical protein
MGNSGESSSSLRTTNGSALYPRYVTYTYCTPATRNSVLLDQLTPIDLARSCQASLLAKHQRHPVARHHHARERQQAHAEDEERGEEGIDGNVEGVGELDAVVEQRGGVRCGREEEAVC